MPEAILHFPISIGSRTCTVTQSPLVKICRDPKVQPGRSRSQLARRAKWPSLRFGICRDSEPRSPEAGTGGAALRAVPLALGSALWG
eukprot:11810649-Alexandrium_andersonii.AAC.1